MSGDRGGKDAGAGPAAPAAPAAEWRNFYGRLRGKGLRAAQRAYLEEDLPRLSPGPVSREENPAREKLDIGVRFGGRPLWLEVGFGGGEHLVALAAAHPEVAFIGCEPYLNGVAMLLGKLRARPLENLTVYPGDVRDLFDVLPEGSVARTYLLYPDPWPKRRHHRRRFVTPGYLQELYRVMLPGAELRLATDIADYVRQALEEVPRAGFEWLAGSARDWREPWEGWVSTRYEQKALREGRVAHYLRFRRQ